MPIAVELKKKGLKNIIVPYEAANEAAIVNDINVFAVSSLKDVVSFLNGETELEPLMVNKNKLFSNINKYNIDFSDVKGQGEC